MTARPSPTTPPNGSPVEIVSDTNPYRKALKDQNKEED